MPESIAQRQLRNDNAEIMRRVEAGESFVDHPQWQADRGPGAARRAVRRSGEPVREMQEEFRKLPPIDVDQWYRDRAEADLIFGDDRIEY